MAKSKSQPASAIAGKPIKVRAIRLGYYDLKRRRFGDVFTIAGDHEFSTEWMERVAASTPEHTTSAQQALDQQNEETLGRRQAKPEGSNDAAGDNSGDDATGNANPLGS